MADKPHRVQLRRTKGWRMPPNTVSVARPTRWGNPFTIASFHDAGFKGDKRTAASRCVDAFRAWALGEHHWAHRMTMPPPPDFSALRGKNLACFCPLDQPCHANFLLELANKD